MPPVTLHTTEGVRHLWTPPHPGEKILALTTYHGVIVIATNHAIYTCGPADRELQAWEVREVVRK